MLGLDLGRRWGEIGLAQWVGAPRRLGRSKAVASPEMLGNAMCPLPVRLFPHSLHLSPTL